MSEYLNRNTSDFAANAEERRLETPRATGFRAGMSSTNLIGRKLASVYEAGSDVPGVFGAVLRRLDGKAPGPL